MKGQGSGACLRGGFGRGLGFWASCLLDPPGSLCIPSSGERGERGREKVSGSPMEVVKRDQLPPLKESWVFRLNLPHVLLSFATFAS